MKCKKVELAGVEPASKRGSHKLSTCLAPTWFSYDGWIRATDHHLSFLIVTGTAKQYSCQFRFILHRLIGPLRNISTRTMSCPDALHRD